MGFALLISDLPQGSLHCEILRDEVQDALTIARPTSAHWAAQIVKHVRSLGLPAPFTHDGTAVQLAQLVLIDESSFLKSTRHAAHADKSSLCCHAAHAGKFKL